MLVKPLLVPKTLAGRVHEEDYRRAVWRELVVPPHVHRFVEMYLVTRGSAVLVAGDRRIPVSAGCLYLIPPLVEHWTTEPSRALRRFNLCIRSASVARILGARNARPLLHGQWAVVEKLAGPAFETIANTFADVVRLSPTEGAAYNAGLKYVFALSADCLGKDLHVSAPVGLHPCVAQALLLMRGDGLFLSRTALSARIGVSPSHLSRLFVQELGEELRAVRSRRRLELAIELLRTGKARSLTDAAMDAGFGSYSQFHRVYVALLGQPPKKQLHGILASNQ